MLQEQIRVMDFRSDAIYILTAINDIDLLLLIISITIIHVSAI